MIKKLKNFKFENYLMFVLILQPVLDIYRTFFQDRISIAGFAIEELINIALIGFVAIMALLYLVDTKDKKHLLMYGGYFAVLAVYLVLHILNTGKFDVSIIPELAKDKSWLRDVYYIMRAYVMPITLMISIFTLGMDNHSFMNAIKTASLVFSAVIVITNITGISLVSYSTENERILGGLFSWGTLNADSEFELYSSRGFFYSANQISSLMFAMMPLIVAECISKFNWKNFGLVVLQSLAMLMIGTKTAAQGTLIILAVMILGMLALHFLKFERIKNKKVLPLLVVVLIASFGLYTKSPSKLRIDYMKYLDANPDRDEPEELQPMTDNQMVNYITHEYWFYYINGEYLEQYPVEDNLDFWVKVIKRDRRLNRDNRNFKTFMINDIIVKNNNPMDKFFGIGYTSGVPYTERDYVFEYYIFGFVGIVLLMLPFIGVVLVALIRILKDMKHKATIMNLALGVALCAYFVTAYIAGHTFGKLINMIFMAYYGAMLLINTKQEG